MWCKARPAVPSVRLREYTARLFLRWLWPCFEERGPLTTLLEGIDACRLQDIPVYVSHMKSMFEREIRSEVRKAGRENLCVLEQGSVLYVCPIPVPIEAR